MKKIKAGIIGLGSRGFGMWKDIIRENGKFDVTAFCDTNESCLEKVKNTANENGWDVSGALFTTDADEVFGSDKVDVTFVFTGWTEHIPYAIKSMKAGKPCGFEVGGAYSIEQCWELVRTYEQTKVPAMMLENCCFDRNELMVLDMVEKGLFGEIVHIDGGYCHNLRRELAESINNGHYRLYDYANRNCDNYPTHDVGPISKILHINHGNRYIRLNSVSSKACGMNRYAEDNEEYKQLKDVRFAQGDVFTTVLTCANGATVRLTLDTTLPRYYSRDFCVHGTKALFDERNRSLYLDDDENCRKDKDHWERQFNNIDEYRKKYDHPIWKQYVKDGVRGSHGGMDWLMTDAFADAILQNKPMPVDVYDAATWMAITVLSEQSAANAGAPVDFPDFTCGKWLEGMLPTV